MIVDLFVDGFRQRFPHRQLHLRDGGTIAVVSGGNPAIGDIEIQDERDEVIVFVGNLTHGHFGCHDSTLTQAERHRRVADDVLDFLAEVFAGRIEFYCYAEGGGGWCPAASGPESSRARGDATPLDSLERGVGEARMRWDGDAEP